MNKCGQRDSTFGVYDMAMGAPQFVVKAASLSLLKPSTKVAVPMAVPMAPTMAMPILHLQTMAAKIPPEFHLPDIPGLPPMPSVSIQKSGNLWMVDPSAQPALKQILGMATFTMDQAPAAQDPGGSSGSLSFSVANVIGDGSAQIDGFIGRGYAAMASIASLSAGTVRVLFTQRPDVVATQAGGDSPTFVLLSDKPTNVVNAANGIAGGATPVPFQPTPGATGPTPAPGTAPPAPSTSPSWLMPLAVGAVLLGGAALLLTASKK